MLFISNTFRILARDNGRAAKDLSNPEEELRALRGANYRSSEVMSGLGLVGVSKRLLMIGQR